jgi:uncharacterized damage-inducible protein DinB
MTTNWTAPTVERIDPDPISGEREALEQWLDYHRTTLLMKCAGLTAIQLTARSVPPSTMSLLGLVRHMVEVERWWFRIYADGQDLAPPYSTDGDQDADFDGAAEDGAESDLARFQREVQAAREAVAGKGLDDVVPSRGDHPLQPRDIRWIYVHMIEEYARHNGHADLIRERIDGATGD